MEIDLSTPFTRSFSPKPNNGMEYMAEPELQLIQKGPNPKQPFRKLKLSDSYVVDRIRGVFYSKSTMGIHGFN